ncbi:MAG: hypothetical protein ACK5S2_10750 [Lysobacteraceae bacterium]|jgi:hypothetical protein|nr:hypothetical protein [Silanimonas sp.]
MTLIAALEHLARQPGPIDLDALAATLDAPTAAALRARDPEALRRAFGDTRTMWCYVATPEDKPVREVPDEAPGDAPDTDTPPDERQQG